jgi:hypothetical protein
MKKTLLVIFAVLAMGLPGSLCFAGGRSQAAPQGDKRRRRLNCPGYLYDLDRSLLVLV